MAVRCTDLEPRTADRPAWRTSPTPRILAWAAEAVGAGARIRAVRPLSGGIAQATDALTIDDLAGRRYRVVLQRWIRPGWETDDVGFDPAKEAAVLTALEATAIPAPRLVRVDPDGSMAGVPSLLTTRLAGSPPTTARALRPASLAELGALLARIHASTSGLGLRNLVPAYGPFGDLARARIPSASRRPDLWRAAMAAAAAPEPPASLAERALLHRDFHPGNTLWLGNRLVGVVDWTSASWGPPAADLAHLRINLVVIGGVRPANVARDAFIAAGGRLVDGPRHDLRTVFDFLGDAPAETTVEPVLGRVEAYLEELLGTGRS